MGILDKFKKEKTKEEEKKVEEKKVEKKPDIVPVKKEEKVAKTGKSALAYQVLKKPHITEKATYLAGKDQYVFEIYPKANKVQVKKAIEDLYGVNVISVNIVKIPPKRKRLGKSKGFTAGLKKAIIKVKKGQKIEVMPR